MTPPRKRRNPSGTVRRRLVIVGLVLLFLLDVVLVAWALTRPATDGAAASAPLPQPSAVASTPVETAAPPAAATTTDPQGRLIAAVDGTSAWRATTADCAVGGVAVERTTTGGDTWVEVDLAASVDVSSVTAIRAADDSYVSVVAEAAEDCAPTVAGSYTAGEYWQEFPDQLAGWYLTTTDRSVVSTPTGERPAPCGTVIALAEATARQAAVLCADQSVFRTTDGGATWDAGTELPGAVAIAADGVDYLVARTGVAPCAGTQLTALGGAAGTATAERGCATAPADAATATAAPTAIAASDDAIWLWAGDSVSRSSDGGTTWE